MPECHKQLVLDFSPGYRKGQRTSQKAYEKAKKAKQCQLVYMAVRCYCNGGTAREIAAAGKKNGLEITHEIVWRRLHDLRDNKYLRNGDNRKCKISGREVMTWWIV